MSCATNLIEVVRTQTRFRGADDIEGVRGLLYCGARKLHSLERGDGYMSLEPGIYEAEMAVMRTSMMHAIRILQADVVSDALAASLAAGRVYIHPANWPYQLSGCISPGLRPIAGGIGSSRSAMEMIFDELGGWSVGRRCIVTVCELEDDMEDDAWRRWQTL